MSILKWDKAFALEQAADDQELLEELLDIFKDSFASDMQRLKTGMETGDAQQIAGAAHSIKGASASLGIVGISETAKMIEEESKGGNLDELSPLTAQLEAMLVEVAGL